MSIKTIHGYHIPPRKKKPCRENAFTIDFVIPGIIPSKKNRQIATIDFRKVVKIMRDLSFGRTNLQEAIARFKTCKPYIRHSKKFQAWEEATKELLIKQAATWMARIEKKGYRGVAFPISDASIKICHFWKDNLRRDNSGKAETIHDIFVLAGILADDDWQHMTPTNADANCYSGEILDHITEIQITAYGWINPKIG
jgi:hypothetical protein